MIRKIFNIIFLIFITANYYGQEPVFSQFYFNPLYMNPAMSGMDNNFRLFLNNKNQWSKIPGQFNTTSISFDSWQNFSNSSLSMLYSSGSEGESYFKTEKFHFGGAYRLFDVFPSPLAWQFGFHYQNITKKLDWSRLVFSDQLDPYLGNVNSTSFITPNSNSFNSSNLALGTVLTYHIKRGTKTRRFHLPIDLDIELGFAVHEFVQRGNSFVNDGVERKITADDILIVAPYNLQVYELRKKLGNNFKIGTIDKFQGQEAAIVIVSFAASSSEDAPRGIEFILNFNRINVAISRAQCLTLIVGSPYLTNLFYQNVNSIKLTNLHRVLMGSN